MELTVSYLSLYDVHFVFCCSLSIFPFNWSLERCFGLQLEEIQFLS